MQSTRKYRPATRSRYAYQAILDRLPDLSYEHARMIQERLAHHLATVALDAARPSASSGASAAPKESYQAQYTRCGKATCRTCAAGAGHGPYWYVYWSVAGKTKKRYVGRAPDEAAARAKDAARRPPATLAPAPTPTDLLAP